MLFSPIQYNEPVFRPPGEGNSAIIQATIGCSWNKCAFCEMYTSKTFQVKSFQTLCDEIDLISAYYGRVKKVFLADGNAFVLSASKLMPILEKVNHTFGRIQRISSYALPHDILSKSSEELKELRSLGLKLLYVGMESGDDELLSLVNKSENYQTTRDGILKAHEAGIDTSIMILNGLGGANYSEQHALNTARLLNEVNPKFLSSLTLSLSLGEKHYAKKFKGDYKAQTVIELVQELKLLIENLNLHSTIFRSDHVSNRLVLKGVISKDKQAILNRIQYAISSFGDDEYPIAPVVL